VPVPEGTPGEVVFTTLTRRGMPLIRYRTGDVSHFVPDPCPCGAALRTLARVRHRADGAVCIGDGALTMADLDEALFALPGVLNFSASVDHAARDILTLEVNVTGGPSSAGAREVDAALEAIRDIATARTLGQLDVAITVRQMGYVLSGPAKRTIVSRPGF